MEEGNYCISTMTPFSNVIIADNLVKVKKRVTKKNLASVIIIDGGLGLGKTTTAVQMASFLQGSPIDLKQQIALGGGELMEKLIDCQKKKLGVLIYDEASDFNRRGALSKFNADINRVFDVCRAFKIIIIMVLPSIKVLDNDLFNKGIVRFIFHIADKSINYNLVWAYSAYRASYLINNLKDTKRNPVPGKCYLKTHPNFDFRTYNLTKERARELQKISTASKLDVLVNTTVRLGGLVNHKQIAQQIGMSQSWVEATIRDNNIKCSQLHHRVKYYEADVLNEIKSKIKKPRKYVVKTPSAL